MLKGIPLTLLDNLGIKRSLYEAVGVREYWVVDVQDSQITGYAMGDWGSYQMERSQVLSGLELEILETALRQSRQMDQSAVGAWLMEQFQR